MTDAAAMLPADLVSMFDLAPVSLWLEDYSGLKQLFDRWRAEGVRDLHAHLEADPRRVRECMAQYKVLQVNQQTLALFAADTQAALLPTCPACSATTWATRSAMSCRSSGRAG